MDFKTISAVPVDVARAIGAVVSRLDAALRRLDDLAEGVSSMHSEMVGMRQDLGSVRDRIDLLREDVQSMSGGVAGIRSATESLDERIVVVSEGIQTMDERLGALAESLTSVDALATRLGRIGGRRGRPATGPEPEPDAA